jgi:hypothetical protein
MVMMKTALFATCACACVLGACTSFADAPNAPNVTNAPNDAGAVPDADVDAGAAGEGGDAAPSSSSAYAAEVVADAPLAFWRLAEKSGTAVLNSEVGSHALVPTNGPLLGAPGLFGGTGGAVAFDGAPGRRLVASTLSNLLQNGQPFAIEMWLYSGGPSDDSYRHLVDQSNGTHEISLFLRAGALGADVYDNGTVRTFTRPEPMLHAWHHVVVQGVSLVDPRLWIDATDVPVGVTGTGYAAAQRTLTIGAESDAAPSLPGGSRVAEIAVYDHVLAPARVLAHFTVGKAP